ncbi:hypothetical protein MmTuc01_1775 [Methanosarcina mazei Tuc01]|uniref:Uncharacterized protein n=1 Tax=Methanosarcina mazei Tuc01 TaxID=1236903 RepID=M1Q487_METMZ|nr:hypothetical protein MmTuc01_1775 [Methanosarcina mazei Tuc01]
MIAENEKFPGGVNYFFRESSLYSLFYTHALFIPCFLNMLFFD